MPKNKIKNKVKELFLKKVANHQKQIFNKINNPYNKKINKNLKNNSNQSKKKMNKNLFMILKNMILDSLLIYKDNKLLLMIHDYIILSIVYKSLNAKK